MNLAAIFPEPRSDAAARIAELGARRAELQRELRDLHAASRDDVSQVDALKRELRDAEARQVALGDADDAVKAARRALSKLEKDATTRAERTQLLSDGVAALDAEARAFATEHRAELWADVTEDALHARDALVTALLSLRELARTQIHVGARATELQRLIDPALGNAEWVRDLPPELNGLTKNAQRLAESIPVPLPQGAATAPYVVEDPPEPAPAGPIYEGSPA